MSKKTTTKTTKKAVPQTTAPAAGCAAFPVAMSARELTNQFVQTKRQTKEFSGDNDYLDALAYAGGLLSSNRDDFNQSKFISLTRGQVTGGGATNVLLGLFADWVDYLIQNRKLSKEFVIDEPTYRWIG